MQTVSYGDFTYPFSVTECPVCGDSVIVGSTFDNLLFPDGKMCGACAESIITGHMYKPSVYKFQDSVMSVTNRFFGVELEYEYRDAALPMSTPTGYSIGSSLLSAIGRRGEELMQLPSFSHAAKTLSTGELRVYAALRHLLDRDESCRFLDTRPLHKTQKLYDDYIYFKHDGSLHNGVELVTHPTTYVRMFEVGWEDIFRDLQAHNYHALTSCGLHIHVTKNSLPTAPKALYSTLANLVVLTQVVYWYTLCELFNRNPAQADRYAAALDRTQQELLHTSPKELVSYQMRAHNRYSAVNLTNASTVEFRIFPSTLSVNKFFASLELADMFCSIAREHSYRSLVKQLYQDSNRASLHNFATQYHKYYLLELMKEVW